jgi:hypothetical protein
MMALSNGTMTTKKRLFWAVVVIAEGVVETTAIRLGLGETRRA